MLAIDNLLIIVSDLAKRCKLTLPCGGIIHGFCHLNISFFVGVRGDKVHFFVANLADCHIITAAEQLEIDNVLYDMSDVYIAKPKQIVA